MSSLSRTKKRARSEKSAKQSSHSSPVKRRNVSRSHKSNKKLSRRRTKPVGTPTDNNTKQGGGGANTSGGGQESSERQGFAKASRGPVHGFISPVSKDVYRPPLTDAADRLSTSPAMSDRLRGMKFMQRFEEKQLRESLRAEQQNRTPVTPGSAEVDSQHASGAWTLPVFHALKTQHQRKNSSGNARGERRCVSPLYVQASGSPEVHKDRTGLVDSSRTKEPKIQGYKSFGNFNTALDALWDHVR